MSWRKTLGDYTLDSTEHEQVTPMSDNWYVVHHTSIPDDPWWAVRHQCDNGQIFGMAFREHTVCRGCKISLPAEIAGFIQLMEWKR